MTLSLRHKMKSERGASMSMALMTFLVCTMVASVTLTAATAVVGRQKTLEEADKNYYSLTSAAKVIRDELNNSDTKMAVAVNRSCVATPSTDAEGNEIYTYHDDGWTIKIDDCGEALVLDGADVPFTLDNSNATIFQILAADMVLGENLPAGSLTGEMDYACTVDCEKVKQTIDSTSESQEPRLMPLTCASAVYAPLIVSVNYDKIDDVKLSIYREKSDDDMPCVDYRFVFESTDGSESKQSFKVTLIVRATVFDSDTRGTWDSKSGTYTFSWDTSVTWECMSMTVGGV